MKTKLIFMTIVVTFLTAPAMADIAGNTVYYHTGSELWTIPDVAQTSGGGFVGDVKIGDFGVGIIISDMTDIAFDSDGTTLYGVSFSGSVYTIDTTTGAATWFSDAPYQANALANFGDGMFYAATADGHFFVVNMTTNPYPTWTDIGQYTDYSGNKYLSAGDIWDTGGAETVYATINDLANNQGWLAIVDPFTATVDDLVPLPDAGPGDMYGLTQNDEGDLLVYCSSKDVWKFNFDTFELMDFKTNAATQGATAVPVPVPAAVLLGLLGFCVAGLKLRKLA